MAKKIAPAKKWRVKANRFVAFIDIMGFTDMVMRKETKEIHDMMLTMHKIVHSNHGYLADGPGVQVHQTVDNVRSTMYSDSIMLYTENDSEREFHLFMMALGGVIANMYMMGIPFKGAIAHGELVIDEVHSIYFGQPIIDAYHLQNEVKFYGVICHDSAERKFFKYRTVSYLNSYECPLDKGIATHYVVTPAPIYFLKAVDNNKLFDGISKMRLNTSGHLRKYIENTENFLVEMSKPK